jgi:ribosomal protein L19E
MTTDLEPLCRSARLNGFIRAGRHALRILREHDMVGTPAYRELFDLIMTADEDKVEELKAS